MNLKKYEKKTKKNTFFTKKILKFDTKHSIICLLYLNITRDGKNEKVTLKEDERSIIIALLSEFQEGNIKVWEDLKVINILDGARYIVQLYYKSGNKYYCNLIKIEKLLSIANFVSLKRNVPLFVDLMRVNQCGTGFKEVAWDIRGEITDGVETNTAIGDSEINEKAPYPDKYELFGKIEENEETFKLLRRTFLAFGAYKTKELGCTINDFVDHISVEPDANDEDRRKIVDNNKAYEYFSGEQVKDLKESNSIIRFVLEYNFD